MKNGTKALLVFIFGVLGALISRLHGGGFFKVNRTVKNILWALPFGLCSFFAILPVTNYLVAGVIATISFGICLGGKATGHGRVWNPWLFLDLSVKAEAFEAPLKFLIGKIPDFLYKTIALSLIGFGAVAGASFVIGYVNPIAGLIVASGGLIWKPIGYIIGFKIDKEFGNEIAEYIAGAGAYWSLALGFILVIYR